MKSLLTLVLLCALAVPTFPEEQLYESGNAFLRSCSVVEKAPIHPTDSELFNDLQCIGYLNGLVDGVALEASYESNDGKTAAFQPFFCVTEGVETGQLVRIVLKYIRDNPDKAHLRTVWLAGAALRKAFPCSKK